MDQLQLLRELQAAAESFELDNEVLGDVTIISALLAEIALTLILFEEFELFRNFNDLDESPETATTASEKAAFNRSVGDMLHGVCCVENAIVRKIEAGTALKAMADDPEPEIPDSCCSRSR